MLSTVYFEKTTRPHTVSVIMNSLLAYQLTYVIKQIFNFYQTYIYSFIIAYHIYLIYRDLKEISRLSNQLYFLKKSLFLSSNRSFFETENPYPNNLTQKMELLRTRLIFYS